MEFYTNVVNQKGNTLIRGIDKDGNRYQRKYKCKPFLFQSTNQDTEWKTINGQCVKRVDFGDVFEAREWVKRCTNINGFDIYGNVNFEYNYINELWPDTVPFDPAKVNVIDIDIEVDTDGNGFPVAEEANFPVTAITLSIRGKYLVLGCKEFYLTDLPDDFEVDAKNIKYVRCQDEADLLQRFLSYWGKLDPDIVTGWNIDLFDIPYLYNRLTKLFNSKTANQLSPWGAVYQRTYRDMFGEHTTYDIVGITSADYCRLYKKFQQHKHESYKLEYIALVELDRQKVDYSEYGSLTELYKNNFQKYIEYNIIDVWLVDQLDVKLNYLTQLMTIAYDAKVNFADVFGTVRMWDVIIHNELYKNKIVVPMSSNAPNEQYPGGFVKDPKVGMHSWVMSFDLTSLYPSIIRQFNLSPETMRGKEFAFNREDILHERLSDQQRKAMTENNYGITCNGVYWDNSQQGFFPSIVTRMFQDRVEYKKKMIQAKQMLERVQAELHERGL